MNVVCFLAVLKIFIQLDTCILKGCCIFASCYCFLLFLVRSFGTENRSAPKHIPPRNETYEFIIFRGSDIKDLHVSEMPKGQPQQQEEAPPQDPAIVSAVS